MLWLRDYHSGWDWVRGSRLHCLTLLRRVNLFLIDWINPGNESSLCSMRIEILIAVIVLNRIIDMGGQRLINDLVACMHGGVVLMIGTSIHRASFSASFSLICWQFQGHARD